MSVGLDQRMWGSNTLLQFASTLGGGPDTNLPDVQLADVPLPESCVASVFFQAEIVSPPGIGVVVTSLVLTLNLGLGRVTVLRPMVWSGVPALGVPLTWTLPFVPVKMLLASVSARGHGVGGTDNAQILCTLEVAPISRFPMTDTLKFGMAKAGEADGLDDELLDDLEEQSPDEADVMRAEQDAGHHPGEIERVERRSARHIPDDLLPPRVRRIVERLTRRLKRPPRVNDLPPWARQELQRHLKGEG